MEPTHVRLTIPDSVDAALLMGPADSLLRRIEAATEAIITVRGNVVSIEGDPEEIHDLTAVFTQLIQLAEAGEVPNETDVDLALAAVAEKGAPLLRERDAILMSWKGIAVKPKTEGQKRYVEAVRTHEITFAAGPAGTGKTYLAVALAVAALRRHEVERIVLTRPVVEAGESLGYLPGTLEEKIDPYVRPLYDALFDLIGQETTLSLVEQGTIEVAPLAFMRGRTFSNAYVILDEAQNTTPVQMKMFLTRLGFHSRFVVTGDSTQRDLKGPSGMESARQILSGIPGIAFCDLGRADVVRHSLVARIIEAYDKAARKDGPHGA
ncbi:MAG: PhoH family protein [Coriobacteriaceae bacterium]|jgi:phosphate starvation-inducible protein PhoH and related proteins|nr:PhoH family protein [Atopobium sp.]MCH4081261.1 PhoH family protein [Atopobiaceae bacterium]MDY5003831.1 PhoH family protein [Atopobiaceae bacterium]RRF95827.1 MAG: PhoH family protein [Coriobacteriaceae bacterium]